MELQQEFALELVVVVALVEVELVTGRTHQIRAHMSYIGHPLLGDGKYGINKDDRARGYKYQALYAYRLRFDFDDNLLVTGADFLEKLARNYP